MKENQEQKRIYVNEIDGELVHTRDMTEAEFEEIAEDYEIVSDDETETMRAVTIRKREDHEPIPA